MNQSPDKKPYLPAPTCALASMSTFHLVDNLENYIIKKTVEQTQARIHFF